MSVSRNSATRIGLIGAGFIAGQHADILAGWSDVAVVAVADPVEPRSRELAARYGAQPFASHVELLADCEVDALFICVPPYARGAPELAAVDRGLPFFVEKPLAADLETAERTAEVVAGAGVATAAGYHWRYLETTRRAQEVLAGCRARLVLGYWFDTTPPVAWWSQAALSGGQMVEQTTHLLDLARYLVGEVKEVYGASAPAAAGVSPFPPPYCISPPEPWARSPPPVCSTTNSVPACKSSVTDWRWSCRSSTCERRAATANH